MLFFLFPFQIPNQIQTSKSKLPIPTKKVRVTASAQRLPSYVLVPFYIASALSVLVLVRLPADPTPKHPILYVRRPHPEWPPAPRGSPALRRRLSLRRLLACSSPDGASPFLPNAPVSDPRVPGRLACENGPDHACVSIAADATILSERSDKLHFNLHKCFFSNTVRTENLQLTKGYHPERV